MNNIAVIVDDEPDGAEALEFLLKEYCSEIEVRAIVNNIEDAVNAIILIKPDILFLDIQMSTGSGFEIIERTRQVEYKIIFTTAHEEYALKAIKANAIDYLLKPIIAEELIAAVNRATIVSNSRLTELLQVVGQIAQPAISNKLSIPCTEGLLFIEPEKILYLEADSNYTDFFFLNEKKITASKTLGEIEKILPGNFVRVHTTYIINLNKMLKYVKGDGGHIIMENNNIVPVSRSQKQSFLKKLR